MANKIRVNILRHWPLILSAGLMIGLLGASLLSNHYLKNLEPYPDGLLYSVVPWEFIKSLTWGLRSGELVVLPNVPPLYSVLMLPMMLVWRSPVAFVLLNVVLQVSTLTFLYLSLKDLIKSKLVLAGVLLLYALNGVVLWYAVLPMAENLALFLLAAAIYLLTGKLKYKSELIALIAVGFILTKYIYYPLAAILGLWSLILALKQGGSKRTLPSIIILAAGGGIALLAQYLLRSGPLLELLGISVKSSRAFEVGEGEMTFFSPDFLMINVSFYVKSLLGFQSLLLWQPVRLTSVLVSLAAILGAYFSYKKDRWLSFGLLVLFLSQFVALRNFYVQDLRYALISIVLIVFLVGFLLGKLELFKKWQKIALPLVVLLLLSQLVMQAGLLKGIVSANLMHRSQSWQQQAVVELSGNSVIDDTAYLITALPPSLFAVYGPQSHQILPLSKNQEFIQTGKNLWTDELTDSQNLLGEYQLWLEEGRTLYITNAYITHQQAVIEDYEAFKTRFDLELVSEGCQEACNLYRLNLKTNE